MNFNVNIAQKNCSYTIFTGKFLLSEITGKIQLFTNAKKILLIISERVNKLYGKDFDIILNAFEVKKFVIKDGEKYKTLKTFEKIMNFALKNGFTRSDCVIGAGGGVVGDIAGFVASTFMRGIDLIQIPTTLLACVDSSVGGKTGVDSTFGKNLIGTFYQPKCVIINVDFLKTLDERQFNSGLGEVLKYAFIEKSCISNNEFGLFNLLNENAEQILNRDEKIIQKIIEICVSLKISVVEKDEKEGGLRQILNFGHTYGHALEKVTRYKRYTHGEAVIQGIYYAFNKAEKMNLTTKSYKHSAFALLEKFGFKAENLSDKKIIKEMIYDKKVINSGLNFVLPTEYAQVEIKVLQPV